MDAQISTVSPTFLTAERPARSLHRKPTNLLDRPDAIVIGSGIGGLGVSSILAQKRGMKVLVVEAQAVPGGSTHPHEYDGYEFPSGLHSVGDMNPAVGPGINRPNFDFVTGGKLNWSKMPDLHESCTFGEDTYDWFSSPEKNMEWTNRLFPGQGDVKAYYALENKIESAAWPWALTKVYPEWVPESVRDGLYKLLGGRWRNAMTTNATEVFTSKLGFSPKLASVFSYMYGNYGRLPNEVPFGMHATFLAHYRHGAYYPEGGPGQIAQCILPILERAGGQVAVSTPVAQIVVENGRAVGIRLESGEQIRAPLIISDAGAHTTFADLLDRNLATELGLFQRCDHMRAGTAFLYLLLGYDEALDLPKHIIWKMATGPGVDPYDLPAADAHWKSRMRFDDMACYLLSPSARDSAHATRYPNTSTIMVLAEARPDWVARAKADPVFKADFEARVTESLLKIVSRQIPAVAGKTPAFIRAGAPAGCNPRAFGDSAIGLQLGSDRFFDQTHWLRPHTPIKGLYLTGQDSFLPGICGSLLSSRFTYAAACNDPLFLLP